MEAQPRTLKDGLGQGRRVASSMDAGNFRMRDLNATVLEKQDEEEQRVDSLEKQMYAFQAFFKRLFIIVGIISTIMMFIVLALAIVLWFSGTQGITKQVDQLKIDLKLEMAHQKTALRAEISESIRMLPQLSVCSFQKSWGSENSTITFEKITSEFSNGDHGSLNRKTGIFMTKKTGYYTAVFSADAHCDKYKNGTRKWANLHLWKNGQKVEESRWFTANQASGHKSYDQGSRTIVSVHHPNIARTPEHRPKHFHSSCLLAHWVYRWKCMCVYVSVYMVRNHQDGYPYINLSNFFFCCWKYTETSIFLEKFIGQWIPDLGYKKKLFPFSKLDKKWKQNLDNLKSWNDPSLHFFVVENIQNCQFVWKNGLVNTFRTAMGRGLLGI